jgi:hypothetical protein
VRREFGRPAGGAPSDLAAAIGLPVDAGKDGLSGIKAGWLVFAGEVGDLTGTGEGWTGTGGGLTGTGGGLTGTGGGLTGTGGGLRGTGGGLTGTGGGFTGTGGGFTGTGGGGGSGSGGGLTGTVGIETAAVIAPARPSAAAVLTMTTHNAIAATTAKATFTRLPTCATAFS